jgi:hypothetical protein
VPPHRRRATPDRDRFRPGFLTPGSHRDLRQSAKVARYVIMLDPIVAGLVYVAAPGSVRSGNVAYLRELLPLQIWGAVWLVAALCTLAYRREAGYAMLALTYLLWAIGTGVTYFTGTMDAPTGPFRALAMAALFWWLRARAVARSAGTLVADDIELRDDDRRRYRPMS